jgi:hypothetical protein
MFVETIVFVGAILLAGTIVFIRMIIAGTQDRSYLLECMHIFLLGFFY